MIEYDKKEKEKGGAKRQQKGCISGSSLSIKTTLEYKEFQTDETVILPRINVVLVIAKIYESVEC